VGSILIEAGPGFFVALLHLDLEILFFLVGDGNVGPNCMPDNVALLVLSSHGFVAKPLLEQNHDQSPQLHRARQSEQHMLATD